MIPDPMEYLRLANNLPQQGQGIYPDSDALPIPQDAPIGGDPIQSSSSQTPPALPVSGFSGGAPQHSNLLDQFHPSTTASDRLNQLIDNQPQYHNPSVWQKIGAAIVGAGFGPDEAQKVLHGGYDRDMNAWLNQSKLAQGAAQDENTANNQQRQIIGAQAINEDRDAKLAQQESDFTRKQTETERENKAKDEVAQEKLATANARAQAYIFKNTHPNWTSKVGADGKLVFFNPQDPTQEINTGFDTGKMDDYDKLNFGLHARMQEIGAQQAGANSRTNAIIQGAADREHDKEGAAKDLAGFKFEHGANNPFGTTTETTTTTPPKSVFGLFNIPGTGGVSKETTSVKRPNTGTTNAQAYSPQIEQSISDAMKLHPDIYPNRDAVVTALKAKGIIK